MPERKLINSDIRSFSDFRYLVQQTPTFFVNEQLRFNGRL